MLFLVKNIFYFSAKKTNFAKKANMKTSKLLKLLHYLKPKERQELEKYIKPSLKSISSLYQFIKKAKFQTEAKSLEKTVIWEKLFGKRKKYSSHYLGDIMSKLSRIVEQFMTEKQFETDKNHQNYLVILYLVY